MSNQARQNEGRVPIYMFQFGSSMLLPDLRVSLSRKANQKKKENGLVEASRDSTPCKPEKIDPDGRGWDAHGWGTRASWYGALLEGVQPSSST